MTTLPFIACAIQSASARGFGKSGSCSSIRTRVGADTSPSRASLSRVGSDARFATDLLPGLLVLGAGVGLVIVAVAVSAMAGIPAQHAGMASGVLMTGHEVGAALGVAVLSAVATAAGNLTDRAGVVDGFSAAFAAAAVLAAVVGVVAYLRMPAARVIGDAAMHMHH
ncbi:MAG: hypothetical protein ABI807_14140 [Sporichthyaceae bacterium]